MDEQKIQEWVNQLTNAIEATAPGTNWWAVWLPPVAVLVAAGLAFALGLRTLVLNRKALDLNRKALEQKQDADARSEWWRRTQWAVDAWLSEDPERRAQGQLMFEVLSESQLAGVDEAKFLNASKEQLDRLADAPASESAEPLSLADLKAAVREDNPWLSDAEVQERVNQALNGDMDETAANEDNEGIKEEGR